MYFCGICILYFFFCAYSNCFTLTFNIYELKLMRVNRLTYTVNVMSHEMTEIQSTGHKIILVVQLLGSC